MNYKELKPVLDAVAQALDALEINYYMIGALARQIWYEKAKKSFRTTKDVDYGILVGSIQEFEAVKTYLVEQKGYTPGKENPFVLISPEGFQVDLLPFGEIEQAGQVVIERTGMSTIQAHGMKEVYENATEQVTLEIGNTFKAATLPGIVLLKLIAYDDRPERRQKDAQDIGNILNNFFELYENLIFENHSDLFGNEQQELLNISSMALGREISAIAASNNDLHQRLARILAGHIQAGETSVFARLLAKEMNKDTESIISYLKDLAWGMQNPVRSDRDNPI